MRTDEHGEGGRAPARPANDDGTSRTAAIGWGAGGALLVVVVLLIVLAVRPSNNSPTSSSTSSTAAHSGSGNSGRATTTTEAGHTESSSVFSAAVQGVTSVPASVLNSVGTGDHDTSTSTADNPLNLTTGTAAALPKVGGKPELFFFGTEWCPYCAVERWALIVALSRFGTFAGLAADASSANDSYPNTQTFTFYGATYTSPYIALASVEAENEAQQSLQLPNAAEASVLKTWDPDGSFPFYDLAGRYIGGLPTWDDPSSLQGLSRTQIVAAIDNPNDAAGVAIDANANYVTAGICEVDGQKPGSVCLSSGVEAAEAQLAGVPSATPF